MQVLKIGYTPTFNAQLKLRSSFVTDENYIKRIDLTNEQIKQLEEKCAEIGQPEDEINVNVYNREYDGIFPPEHAGWVSYCVPDRCFSGTWVFPPTFENIMKTIDSHCKKAAHEFKRD